MNDGFVTRWEIAMTSVSQLHALAGELKLAASLAHRLLRSLPDLFGHDGLKHPWFLTAGLLGGSRSVDLHVNFQAPTRRYRQRPMAGHGTEKKYPLCFQQLFPPEA